MDDVKIANPLPLTHPLVWSVKFFLQPFRSVTVHIVGIACSDCFRRLLEVNTEQGVKEPLEVEDLAVQTTIEAPELGIS